MKLTKKNQTEILKAYNTYWENYLHGNVEAMIPLLASTYSQVGSAETEVFYHKKEAVKFLYDTIEQVAGKLEMRNRKTKLEQRNDLILVHEICDVYALDGKNWIFYSNFRASTLMKKLNGKWKFIHQHSSFPDARTSEGENIAIDKIAEENRELRGAVKRRTTELEQKNRELEIEASLERVRSAVLEMKKQDDLMDVVKALLKELNQLGFTGIRNAQIDILDEEKKTYLNYLHSDYGVSGITENSYENSPFHKKFIDDVKSAPDALFFMEIKGKELDEWRELRKKTVSLDDPMLEKISALYFYSYSIGTGAVGVSAFEPIDNSKLEIIKKFRNVFFLSYRRFRDIVLAEKQAREAEIELALERVRARTMAMQKSEELKEVIQLVYEQFIHLNIQIEHTGFILDYKAREDLHIWLADQREIPSEITIPCFNSLPNNSIKEAKEKGKDFFKYLLSFEEKNKFYRDLFKFIPGVPEESLEYYFNCPGLAGSGVLLENVGLYIENFSGTPFTDEENNTLMRFGKVFQQTYTRFLDLQKAEAQAREAQIEAALERVRARSMGMHKSNELKDVVRLLYKEFRILLTNIDSVNIQLNPDSSKDIHLWASVEEDIYPELYHVPYVDLPIFEKFYNAFKSPGDGFFDHLLNKEEKDAFFSEVFKVMPVPSKRKKMIQNAEGMVMVGWFHKHSGIDIVHYNLKRFSEEEKDIVKRFAATFEQTYIRFLDLQKAEAQTREAEIQLALERVRARTMAMHKSNELAETAAILFQQMTELGVTPERLNICLIKEEEKILEVWATDQQGVKISHHFNASLNEPTTGKRVYDAWKEKKKSIVIDLSGKELNDWLRYVREVMGMTIKAELVREHRIHSVAFFSQGMILTTTPEPLPKESIKLLERFADVFNLTYRRFLDLKKAEAQAREAQIEAALERVRSLALGMRKSEEVGNVTDSFFNEFNKLSVDVIGCSIVVIDEDKDTMELWRARSNVAVKPFESSSFNKSMNILKKYLPQWFPKFYSALEERKNYLIEEMSSNTRLKFINSIAEQYNYSEKEKSKLFEVTPEKINAHFLFFKLGYLALLAEEKLPDENLAIARRFIEAFAFAYIRFLDIKKAEAQAREAQIEAALERVRSRSMGMHSSDELREVVAVLYNELEKLNFEIRQCVISILNDKEKFAEWWSTGFEDKILPKSFIIPYDNQYIKDFLTEFKSILKDNIKYRMRELSGEGKRNLDNTLFEHTDLKNLPEDVKKEMMSLEKIYLADAFMKYGILEVVGPNPVSAEKGEIIQRFAKVFEQTYTRFLDLKKAEDRTREAKIEASLEKVRTVALTMKKSDAMLDIAQVLYEQLIELGFNNIRNTIIDLHNERNKTFLDYDYSLDMGRTVTLMSYHDHPIIEKQVHKIKSSSDAFFELILEGQDLRDLIDIRLKNGEEEDSRLRQIEKLTYNLYSFGDGAIGISNFGLLSDEQKMVLKRFRNVFTFAYKRYTDMIQAEIQAREAEIQLALERIRARTMAMRHSSDLQEVVNLVAHQLNNMKLDITGVFLGIKNDEIDKQFTFWGSTGVAETYMKRAAIPFLDRPIYTVLAEATTKGERFFMEEYTREEKIEFFEHLFKHPPYNSSTLEWRNQVLSREGGYTRSVVVSHFTFIFVVNHFGIKLSDEDNQILKRFAKVFDHAYTRFLDLQKAEAQAREVVKQASLDRVRGEISSMRTAEDLNRITPIIWNELKTLEVPFIRCGVFIIDEEQAMTRVYLTTPDGKSLGVLNLSFDANELTSNSVEYWRKKEIYREYWDKQKFINWTKSMMELGQVQNVETYQGSSAPPESLHLHFVPFAQGMLYVGDVSPLTDEKLDLVKTLAEAFSIAYARYEDFKNLEDAKNKIELTFNELKSAQAQLIHAEKLASLGELTAGIAHEIKNPLNFVNNFSELSKELLDEIKTELENNNKEEILAILEDMKINLEKINEHGKRADSIVKGMLLHSRGTSGEKTLTDINDLLDQYVNLAYHGMRAQNKEFNITIEKDFDKTLEKIDVVPQDISRVFLNIINNACYAAYDRKKKNSENNFYPTLKVSTKQLNGKVEIRIGDNGNGIPKEILAKIFQPFFTTKPTGEGTGLGLSLSYDIVTKVHGGELKVETKEGQGTEFIIKLNVESDHH